MKGLTASAAFCERFAVEGILGAGGMGVVLSAKEARGGREVAIKVLTRLDSAELAARFRREGQSLTRIRHPHVVDLFELESDLALPFMIMELLPGGSLAQRIAAGPLPVRQAAVVAGELAAGLAACHAAGVVHRDVKPGNVLFDAAGRAKLSDLGIARSVDAGTLSPRGLVLGTPGYLSPEQARGEEVGAAADLYALGIVTYEMLAGQPPFVSSNAFKLMKMQEESAPPPLAVPGLPERLAALIARLLAKDARARPATADEVAAELAAIVRELPEPAAPDSPPPALARAAVPAPTERLDASAGTLELHEAHLTIIEGPALGREVACGTRAVSIGSAPESDLEVPDSAVSRQHARLETRDGRLLLHDLSSTNGTFVGGVRVQSVFVQPGDLIRVGKTTLALRVKARSTGVPPHAADRLGRMVGASAVMRQLFTVLEWMAPTPVAVLIHGPTGTGKELAARVLHEAQSRTGPFVVIDCAALDAAAASSELFGHEAGAFPGATARRTGLFEEARGGTVFLDEVGDLPLDLQPKLLRVLEAREVRPVGSNVSLPVDVRVVAATNRSLDEMVAQGKFREDLYHRLGQLKIAIPALAERREDIPLLVRTFLAALPEATRPTGLSGACQALLFSAHYPGNVRQLKNLVDRAAHLARRRQIEVADLLLTPAELAALTAPPAAAASAQAAPASAPARKRKSDREALLEALEANDWNLTHAARALDVALNTLKTRMEKFDIPRKKP